MEFKHILFDVSDEIATITLNRPEARNALSQEMRKELDVVLPQLKEQAGNEIKALIITGAGRAFCAGGDVKAMQTRSPAAEAGRRRMRESHNRLYDIANLELPVLAAVDGPAAGAGCTREPPADTFLDTPRTLSMPAYRRLCP